MALSSVDANLTLPFGALNQNLLLIRLSKIPTDGANCKDQIWLGPRIGTDLGPKSPNNKFVESGRKSYSESRIKILVYSVKRKELYSYIYRKYPRTCPSTRTETIKFFLFFCCISLTFMFFLFFLSSLFLCVLLFLFLRIIYYGFLHHFLHPRVGQVLGVLFFCFPCLFLNLLFLAVRLLVHCSGITSTLMRPES